MENQENHIEIILGVDTHLEIHVGVVIDAAGRVLGTLSVGTHNDGYKQLLSWAQTFELLRRAGVEGTGLVRRSAVKAKTQTINQIKALLVSAPQAIRDAVYKVDAAKCVRHVQLCLRVLSQFHWPACKQLYAQPGAIPAEKHRLHGGNIIVQLLGSVQNWGDSLLFFNHNVTSHGQSHPSLVKNRFTNE